MLLGKDGDVGKGVMGASGVRESEGETLETERPAAVWLAFVVVFGARKPRRSPNEFIIMSVSTQTLPGTQDTKQDLDFLVVLLFPS